MLIVLIELVIVQFFGYSYWLFVLNFVALTNIHWVSTYFHFRKSHCYITITTKTHLPHLRANSIADFLKWTYSISMDWACFCVEYVKHKYLLSWKINTFSHEYSMFVFSGTIKVIIFRRNDDVQNYVRAKCHGKHTDVQR